MMSSSRQPNFQILPSSLPFPSYRVARPTPPVDGILQPFHTPNSGPGVQTLNSNPCSRDDHFQCGQGSMYKFVLPLHIVFCVSPWLGIFRHAVTVARVICRRYGRVKTGTQAHSHTHTRACKPGSPTGGLESKYTCAARTHMRPQRCSCHTHPSRWVMGKTEALRSAAQFVVFTFYNTLIGALGLRRDLQYIHPQKDIYTTTRG